MVSNVENLMRSAERLRQWHLRRLERRRPHLRDEADSKTLEALWKAARAYRPGAADFSSLAGVWVRGAIKQVLRGDLPSGYRYRVRLAQGQHIDHLSLGDPAVEQCVAAQGRTPASLDDGGTDLWDRAMQLLASDRQRAVLEMALGYDLGTTEIAERLGVPEQTARNTIRQAINRLRKALGGGA